ncbi:hypothetical protein, partial [Lactobacillus agrestimuris]|uniref:hypothetical protein n=1 Tax=Lactobacillus agrestimuris TaxID=2941328 RepID=UPI00204441F3
MKKIPKDRTRRVKKYYNTTWCISKKSNIKYYLTKRIKASNIFNCRRVIKKTYLRRKKEFKK